MKEKKISEKELIVYGTYSKNIDSLVHFDELQNKDELKISKKVRYAVAGVGILLGLQNHSNYVIEGCAFLGLVLTIYILSIFLSGSIKYGRMYFSCLVDQINYEEKNAFLPEVFHQFIKKNEVKKFVFFGKKKLALSYRGGLHYRSLIYALYVFLAAFSLVLLPIIFLEKLKHTLLAFLLFTLVFFVISWIFFISGGTTEKWLNKLVRRKRPIGD